MTINAWQFISTRLARSFTKQWQSFAACRYGIVCSVLGRDYQ
jgi:hypothetical protein